MKKNVRWGIIGLVSLFLIALLVRNSIQSPMLPRASEAWSRGRIIGRMLVKRAVTLQIASDGGVFLAWSNLEDKLELAHLGVDGEVLLDRVLPIQVRKARDPQLQVGTDGRLRLLWREQEGQQTGIHYALLQADGTPVGQPQMISESGSRISEAPRLFQGEEGRLYALWTDDVGIHWAVLNDAGEMVAGPALLISEGDSSMIQKDDEGRLHIIWQYQEGSNVVTIYYAVLDPEQGALSDPEEVAQVVISGPMELEAMGLGLSQNTAFVFWTEFNSKYYQYAFKYASFPLNAPQQRRVVFWQLRRGTGPVTITPLGGQQSPLPVALSELTVNEDEQVDLQVALITVGGGQNSTVEQFVSASSQASTAPILVVDSQSNLHMAWVETGGFGEFQVVYASTAPEVMANYNAFTLVDGLDAALDGIFLLSTVIVSLLIALLAWAAVPVVGLGIYHLVTHEETLSTKRAQWVVIVALVVEVVMSFLVPPRIGVDITWPVLRWLVPVVSVVVTTAVTVRVIRRPDEMHLFGVFFLFTIMYSVLQTILFLVF